MFLLLWTAFEINPDSFLFQPLTPFRVDFLKSKKVYDQLGQFDYPDQGYNDNFKEFCVNFLPIFELCWLFYVGQMRPGTTIFDGIGIWVWSYGDTPFCIKNNCIYEGYWKNNRRVGPGRYTASAEDSISSVCNYLLYVIIFYLQLVSLFRILWTKLPTLFKSINTRECRKLIHNLIFIFGYLNNLFIKLLTT